jgi:D-alanyl-D-alanine carboxypeptidase
MTAVTACLASLLALSSLYSCDGAAPSRDVESVRERWVSPSKCLSPCDFAPELVSLGADGIQASDGPFRLVHQAQLALEQWLRAARAAGYSVEVSSAHRSYDEQLATFMQAEEIGRAARPGHSEHQLGTAVDLRYQGAAAEAWLAETSHRFGFVQSYPVGKERVTGYRAEPWHFRFVGVSLAQRARGRSLEELFTSEPSSSAPPGDCRDCRSPSSRADCTGVDAAGRCDGSILSWCFEGTLARVDCASSGRLCGEGAAAPGCR